MKTVLFCLLAFTCLVAPSCRSTSAPTSAKAVANEMKKHDAPATSIAELIGRKPNVTVSGSGSNVSVQIRGRRSINSTNEPLYVVDGNVLGSDYSRVANLNPGDVARIDIISDPATLSSYGSRGANGVIDIILKR